ncbi:hypothetical protein Acy02nite_47500 [Actinoplanes cyaneus]|uniref:Uncharacterized protein n=1 Tax=Actinoplanes cyaneus TaxID=52696 RepID=A0A919IJC7_9ACTN|nr:hypothetical protein [Actinoplanes cyaneus]MCW2138801.1 hypothetical protein [Actinoplanes cyaneus]GID66869.1 hypothetical protein Acy02nite_47500 [Actinoplanes cyaneus]
MIRRQTVQWILLPNGLTPDGQLSASVFVAPRLRPGDAATLADFPDFADWPAVVAGLELTLVRPDGVTEAPLAMSVTASSGLWAALFPGDTTVRPFTFGDLADRPLISYPVTEVLSHLRERWADLAYRARDDLPVTGPHASPIGGPPGGRGDDRPYTLVDHFTDLRSVRSHGLFEGVADGAEFSDRLRRAGDEAARAARDLRERHANAVQPLIRPFGAGGSPAAALHALAGFHARPSSETPKAFPATRDELRAELAEQQDFHHQLSAVGDHPALLRQLGLVIDLQIRPDFVPATTDGDPPVPLRLRVTRASAFPARGDHPGADVWNTDVTPATWCRLTTVGGQAVFTAVERSSRQDYAHGFLHLDPARYTATAVDVDGLALKALNLAATLHRQDDHEQRPVEEPDREGIPTARTGGVALVHSGHANDLHEGFYDARAADDALEKDPDNPKDIAAEDVVRGYRLDIGVDGQWRSLHRRQVTYRPERDPGQATNVTDEGHVQLGLTAEADRPGAPADPDRALYAHETLTTWDGWSLAVPRPGSAIAQEPAAPEAATDLTSMRLGIDITPPPATLPRLRFGTGYRVRVRTVDLAGNAHPPEAADAVMAALDDTHDARYTCTTPVEPLIYRRFEPVPPPELLPRRPFGPGEGAERLVIRSAPGQSAESYAAASQTTADESLRFHAVSERHLAAPKAALQLVEAHGRLDEVFEAVRGLDPEAAVAAAQGWYEIVARESGSFRDAPQARFVATGTHDGVEQGYVCLDRDTVDLPYLPDPLSVGVKVRLVLEPGQPEQVLDLTFPDGGDWYRPDPLRLRLAEGDYAASFDPAGKVLTVALPAGRTAQLRVSSLMADDPELFGIVGWCDEELSPDRAAAVRQAVRDGTHWMTTPWRDLVLVHAVQQPLWAPKLDLDTDAMDAFAGRFVLARGRGETTADVRGRMFFDLPSTAQVDVEAIWDDETDDPGRAYPDRAAMVHRMCKRILSLPVPEPFGTPWQPELAPWIEPLDRDGVSFRGGGHDEQPEDVRRRLLDRAAGPGLNAPERRRLEAGAAQLEQLRAHEFGDTRYRRVSYQPVASTRFREYFDPAMPSADVSATGEPQTIEVLSSAPPTRPVVLQVLPLLGYDQERTGDTTLSRREGLGLRVWLGRPWFSSGTGELLAVVCNSGGPVTADDPASRVITMITANPAYGSAVPLPLRADSFPDAVRVRRQAFDAATFAPVWDAGRQAWYCDLRFDTGDAYFPFVRLALGRYQPYSLPGCELSALAVTAFVQTLPDRTLTCTHGDGQVAVSVTGPAPSAARDLGGAVVTGGNELVAVVEIQPEEYADPLLGWTALGPETLLTADADAVTHRGDVSVPEAPGQRRRLVVREFEHHPTDDRSAGGFVVARRLVHADAVPL